MKSNLLRCIQVAPVALVLAVPVRVLAQSTPGLTRDQLKAEIIELRLAGLRFGAGRDPHYPDNNLAAEGAAAVQRNSTAPQEHGSYDEGDQGSSESGGPRR